jgi:MATE family multidrug resistance protein
MSDPTAAMNNSYSHREVWRIAAPMILSAISTPLVGLVDTALMGHLDSPIFMAATAAGATIFSVLFMSLNFLRMGTTGVTAQAFGSSRKQAIVNSLAQPAVMAAILGLLLIALQRPAIELSLSLLGLSDQTGLLAQQYFSVRILSAPVVLANFVLTGWLLGMQNARGPLAIMLTINLTNIVLDLLFVISFGMGIKGVALATLCAEFSGLLIGLIYLRSIARSHRLDWSTISLSRFQDYKKLLAINTNLFFRSIALMFTLAFITARGARLGDVFLAANAVLMNFQLLLSYALDGIAHAAEALSGKALGAANPAGLIKAVQNSLLWTLLLAALFTCAYLIGGKFLINLMTNLPEVRATAYTYLPWIVASPFISAGAFLYDGVLVGLTRSREMRLIMTGAAVLVFLPAWYLTREFGNHGLWFAFMLFMATRSLAMHLCYKKIVKNTDLFAS